jgi:hypothetical protein
MLITPYQKLRQKAERHLNQYRALTALYKLETGIDIPSTAPQNPIDPDIISGETLYYRLLLQEYKAHKFAEDLCNKNVPERIYDKTSEEIKRAVLKLFNGSLQGFLLNLDPRGYSLKISSEKAKELHSIGFRIETDWGSYGLLAPNLD